jgi:hypothetical protein
VSKESLAKGFLHDWAAAEMHLGKMLSRFGFQADATERFAAANEHFRQYDVLRETLECLFWEAVTRARTLDLSGHPRDSVLDALAITKLYRKLYESTAALKDTDGHPVESAGLTRLWEALEDHWHPDVGEVLLALRLGYWPEDVWIERLRSMAAQRGDPGSPSWPQTAQSRLVNQLLRLIHLQRVEPPPTVGRFQQRIVAGEHREKRLRKLAIRDKVLSALEGTLRGNHSDFSCLALQAAYRDVQKLGLRGGLVPFLVDLSQFFIDRDCFIALLLLLLDAVDRAIRAQEGVERKRRLDTATLKKVYRSLTRYLVLERNFYLGPPLFRGEKNPALWQKIEERHDAPEWWHRYRLAVLGDHGISYPALAMGIGWVESIDTGGATLRIVWLSVLHDGPLRNEDFRRIEVPHAVVAQGRALKRMTPVVLLGRHVEPEDQGSPWTAHRIPIELDVDGLFRDLDDVPWYEPVPERWQALMKRFSGQIPATCQSPPIGVAERREIEKRSVELARTWFGGLPRNLFKRIFGISHPAPAEEEPEAPRVAIILDNFPSRRRPQRGQLRRLLRSLSPPAFGTRRRREELPTASTGTG